jgi:hypothetical protein
MDAIMLATSSTVPAIAPACRPLAHPPRRAPTTPVATAPSNAAEKKTQGDPMRQRDRIEGVGNPQVHLISESVPTPLPDPSLPFKWRGYLPAGRRAGLESQIVARTQSA